MGRKGKLPTIYTTEQLITIFDACDKPKLSMVMWMGLFCGLRINEICKLKTTDVNLVTRKVFVRDSKNPLRSKQGYGKDRYVSIPQIALSPIKKWIELLKGAEWFIPSMQSPDKHILSKTVHEQFRHLLNTCNLSEKEYVTDYKAKNWGERKQMQKSTYKFRFHTLRHTYASYLLDKGVPLENIQRALGHQDLDTTLIYARVTDKRTATLIDDAFNMPLGIVNKESIMTQKESPHPQQNTYNTLNTAILPSSQNPLEVLQLRLAKGEIDFPTYQVIHNQLTQNIQQVNM
jgi:integrase